MPHWLTHSKTLKDTATQLLIKYKSGALVTQWQISGVTPTPLYGNILQIVLDTFPYGMEWNQKMKDDRICRIVCSIKSAIISSLSLSPRPQGSWGSREPGGTFIQYIWVRPPVQQHICLAFTIAIYGISTVSMKRVGTLKSTVYLNMGNIIVFVLTLTSLSLVHLLLNRTVLSIAKNRRKCTHTYV